MAEHGKEPWYVGAEYEQLDPGIFIADATGLIVCSADSEPTKENARRIVTCVNALSGIPTKNIENSQVLPNAGRAFTERDELLAALKVIIAIDKTTPIWPGSQPGSPCAKALKAARKAIAEAEGKA